MMDSLWGEEFVIKQTPQVAKSISNKIKNPTTISNKKTSSSKIPIDEQMRLIRQNVKKILGSFAEDTVLIKSREQLTRYIDCAISNGYIAVDTETNNSLDPITCTLMGLCIYTPGEKNAYVPINHVDLQSRKRLDWQLTERDLYEELSRLNGTKIIMHNGKFDYQVIKCTVGISLSVYWDTMIAVRILNENEKRASLKQQYIDKIDSKIEKYDIEHLFEGLEYSIFEPELFALYAATDAYMTYKLYLWQKKQFDKPDNDKIFKLFLEVEMPVMVVAAEMELTGIEIDVPYANRLSEKYHKMLDSVQDEISEQLDLYKSDILNWRTTIDANVHSVKKGKASAEYISTYCYLGYTPLVSGTPCWYNIKDGRVISDAKAMSLGLDTTMVGKSKSEQLKDPPELSSPAQFAILMYDVLKSPVVDSDSPRGTGESILKEIEKQTNNKLCGLVLKQRGIDKLLGTYIDKLPECVNPKTHRLHAHFNQMGTETGRFSSSDPNLQNIPSHEKSIRMMFKATDGYTTVGADFSLQNVG